MTGASCADGESFTGDNPLKLSATGVGIIFDDTGGTSTNDWQLGVNAINEDSIYFTDITGGTTPLKIIGTAPSNSLFVAADGRIGMGTNLPKDELHISALSPSLLFEDTFGALQIWKVGGNSGNFFIQDSTTGVGLTPFAIIPGAPDHSLKIASDGDIGMGTFSPEDALHIKRDDGSAVIRVEDAGAAIGYLSMLELINNSGRARMQFTSTGNVNQTGDWSISSGLTFVLQERLTGSNVFIMDNAGNLTITGELTTAGSCSVGCDRVFDADYALPSIAEHNAAMWQNGYLPNVGPTAEDAPFNVSDKMGRMLNELEHAHIFIGQQQEQIEAQNSLNAAQESRIAALEAKLEALLSQ